MFLPKINAIVTKKAMNNFVHHLFTFKNTTRLGKKSQDSKTARNHVTKNVDS